jgi:hypothetical protein
MDYTNCDLVPFEKVYVATPSIDTAKSINLKLSAGLHVVMAPGIYHLEDTIVVPNPNQVLFL